jgi:GWxTD domain-containing protein
MTFLMSWVQTASAKALGWTLLHSLWEGAAIALVLAIVLGIARSSRVRYAAACLAMLALLAGFGVTFYRLMPRNTGAASVVRALPEAVSPSPDDLPVLHTGIRWDASDLLPWLAPLWLAGVLLFQLRCLAAWVAAGRIRRIGVCGAPDDWAERLQGLRARMRMTRPVTLLESCFAEVPVVIGHLRPVILMPVGLLTGMPAGQVESILLHELAHIRRADYLVNLMQTLVEGLLFYHPAVWWISRVIRTERENCCDDLVVETNGDAHEYAAALASLAENRWAMREAAMAATGGNLVKRIQRLLAPREGPRAALAPVLSAGILVVTCGLALAAWQSPQQNPPAILPLIPVPAAPSVKLSAQPQDAPSAAPVASPRLVPQLEQLRELTERIEAARHGRTMMLAQNDRASLADPSLIPYMKWLNEEVVYIITDAERKAFLQLRDDSERNMFIKQFWARRDPMNPTPREEYPVIAKGNPENEYKKEHYRRIKYANDRFGTKIPGWKTDRGRIYIQYGPPDEIESHPSVGTYTRPPEQGGGQTSTYPFEQWMYRYIEGIGKNVIMEFVDTTMTGDYRMTMDPMEKEALASLPLSLPGQAVNSVFRSSGFGPQAAVTILAYGRMLVTVPFEFQAKQYSIGVSVVSSEGKTLWQNSTTEEKHCDPACPSNYIRTMGYPPPARGSYTLTAVVKDAEGSEQKTYVVHFTVN